MPHKSKPDCMKAICKWQLVHFKRGEVLHLRFDGLGVTPSSNTLLQGHSGQAKDLFLNGAMSRQ